MSKFTIKKLPPIKLVDLLKKRKTNLKQFLETYGIVAYSTLQQKCNSLGVSPPSEQEFKENVKSAISSPQEGVVVLDPPPLVKEATGEFILVDDLGNSHVMHERNVLREAEEEQPKASKKNKEKSLKIDESVFVVSLPAENFEKTGPDLGEAVSVDDDLDSSVTKLSTLKKTK